MEILDTRGIAESEVLDDHSFRRRDVNKPNQ